MTRRPRGIVTAREQYEMLAPWREAAVDDGDDGPMPTTRYRGINHPNPTLDEVMDPDQVKRLQDAFGDLRIPGDQGHFVEGAYKVHMNLKDGTPNESFDANLGSDAHDILHSLAGKHGLELKPEGGPDGFGRGGEVWTAYRDGTWVGNIKLESDRTSLEDQMGEANELAGPHAKEYAYSSRHTAIPEHLDRKWKNDTMNAVVQSAPDDSGGHGITLRDHPGDGPQHGYMVSLPKSEGHEEHRPMEDVSGGTLGDYADRKRDVINRPGNSQGGWEQGRDWYDDVSKNYGDLWHADKDAYTGDQQAIYDLDRDRSVDTDEAGWMTGAPWITGRQL